MHFSISSRRCGALSWLLFAAVAARAQLPLTLDSAVMRAWSQDPVVQIIQLTPVRSKSQTAALRIPATAYSG